MIIYKYLWGTEIGKTKLPLSQKRRIWLAFNEEAPVFLKTLQKIRLLPFKPKSQKVRFARF